MPQGYRADSMTLSIFTEDALMRTHYKTFTLPCILCKAEIPLSEIFSPEARDYVMYFFGRNCFNEWRKRAQRKFNPTHRF